MNNTPTIEETYTSNESLEHRKKSAQFFTPEEIAKIMCLWLLKNISLKNVLEPAFGLGVFTRQILAMKNDVKVDVLILTPLSLNMQISYFQEMKMFPSLTRITCTTGGRIITMALSVIHPI